MRASNARRMRKLQSAMEYLMTYGWAILIIAIVLAALFSLGVFGTGSLGVKAPPGSCSVFRPQGPGTTTNLNLQGVCNVQPQYVLNSGTGANVAISTSPTLAPTTTAISMSYWLNMNQYVSGSSWQQIFGNNPYANGYLTWIDTSTCQSGYTNCIGGLVYISGTRYDASRPGISLNTWYHVVITAKTGGYILTYLNGQPYNSPGVALPAGNIQMNSNPFTILSGQSGTYFKGAIANVQVYNAALDASQVQALYQEGIGGAPVSLQNLSAWYPLNGDTKDYSGNSNNGAPSSIQFTTSWGAGYSH